MYLISRTKKPPREDNGNCFFEHDKRYYAIDIETGDIKDYSYRYIKRIIKRDMINGGIPTFCNFINTTMYKVMSLKTAREHIEEIKAKYIAEFDRRKRSAVVGDGMEETIGIGNVPVKWDKYYNNYDIDKIIISIGNIQVPIIFENEGNSQPYYGAATSRELYEWEATTEYAVCIGDFKVHKIYMNTFVSIAIYDYQETNGAISFELVFKGVYLGSSWSSIIGKVKIENGKIVAEKSDMDAKERHLWSSAVSDKLTLGI